jgi:hypothetical protein
MEGRPTSSGRPCKLCRKKGAACHIHAGQSPKKAISPKKVGSKTLPKEASFKNIFSGEMKNMKATTLWNFADNPFHFRIEISEFEKEVGHIDIVLQSTGLKDLHDEKIDDDNVAYATMALEDRMGRELNKDQLNTAINEFKRNFFEFKQIDLADTALLSHLYIDPGYRTKGLSYPLMCVALNILKTKFNKKYVVLWRGPDRFVLRADEEGKTLLSYYSSIGFTDLVLSKSMYANIDTVLSNNKCSKVF